MAKTKLQKKKDNPNSSYWRTKALNVWREICLIKYGNKCAICSSTEHLEAHHIISKKTCKSLTYNTTNQICLCSKHHNWHGTENYPFSAHKHPLKFYHFISKNYPELYNHVLGIDVEAEKNRGLTTKEYYEELLKIKEEFVS